ncbi:MAG: S8 family serine peptidase, partial [Cyanobacteria bacterium J06600_6]
LILLGLLTIMSDNLTASEFSLNLALIEVRDLLADFISESNFDVQIGLAFGSSSAQQSEHAKQLIAQWLDGIGAVPEIKIVPSSLINWADGAYAVENNTIYLSQEYLAANNNNIEAISDVIVEELGHAFSSQLTLDEAPGDEGAIFSKLVREETIEPRTLSELLVEDDIATVAIGDREIQIEQARQGANPAFDLIGLTALRNDPDFADLDGTGFDVVVIDSGLERTHPLLDDNYRTGFDYINNDGNPDDLVAHGTHVAGTIGAEDENIGVAPDVGLIGLKVGDDRGPNSFAVNRALQAVLDDVNNPDTEFNIVAINLSLGEGFFIASNQPNSFIDNERRRIIQDLEAAGVVVVAAAGNSYIGKEDSRGNLFDATGNILEPNQELNIASPAIYSTLAVGAVWQDNIDIRSRSARKGVAGEDRITEFSQRLNSDNFLFAPGAFINSTVPLKPGGGLLSQSFGTSQASPHVAGAVVLLQEIAAGYDVRLSPEQIRDYLINNADIIVDGDDEQDIVENTELAYPRINIYKSAIALRDDLEDNDLAVEDNSVEQETNAVLNDVIDEANRDLNGSIPQITTDLALSGRGFRASIGKDGRTVVGDKDVDLYRINSSTSGILEIDIDSVGETAISDYVDSVIVIFDEQGNSLGLNDDTDTTDSLLRIQIEANTDYYAAVTGFGNQDLNPLISGSGSGGDTGDYILNSRLLRSSAAFDISNNVIGGGLVSNIAVGDTFAGILGEDNGYILGARDVDLYRFVPVSDDTVTIRVDASQAFDADTFLRLFNARGDEIAFNDDENSTTRGSFLEIEVEAGSEYYIGINGYSRDARDYDPLTGFGAAPGSQGDYILTVSD